MHKGDRRRGTGYKDTARYRPAGHWTVHGCRQSGRCQASRTRVRRAQTFHSLQTLFTIIEKLPLTLSPACLSPWPPLHPLANPPWCTLLREQGGRGTGVGARAWVAWQGWVGGEGVIRPTSERRAEISLVRRQRNHSHLERLGYFRREVAGFVLANDGKIYTEENN
ncbi:hypothetical protein E2C01_049917 [Portunus trituberculatus]|uniref:Uncharacterized protein n=1 Tax=Portunus trituberculatus TaxID=210409 RepID=A0A5B7GFM8_PORTR|nr:hypothetical protein [Portunus trituberculatus]